MPECWCAAAVLQVLCMTFGQQQMVMTRLYSYIVNATPQVCDRGAACAGLRQPQHAPDCQR